IDRPGELMNGTGPVLVAAARGRSAPGPPDAEPGHPLASAENAEAPGDVAVIPLKNKGAPRRPGGIRRKGETDMREIGGEHLLRRVPEEHPAEAAKCLRVRLRQRVEHHPEERRATLDVVGPRTVNERSFLPPLETVVELLLCGKDGIEMG